MFISKELTNEEAAIENASLKKRRELIEQDRMNKKGLRGTDCRSYIQKLKQFDLKKPVCYYTLNYLIRVLFSHAIQTIYDIYDMSNIYDIICLTDTFLTENVAICTIFLEIHRSDRKYVNGKTKDGGVTNALSKEIPHCCISSNFDDCLIINLLIKSPILSACIYFALKGSEYRCSTNTLTFFCLSLKKS